MEKKTTDKADFSGELLAAIPWSCVSTGELFFSEVLMIVRTGRKLYLKGD